MPGVVTLELAAARTCCSAGPGGHSDPPLGQSGGGTGARRNTRVSGRLLLPPMPSADGGRMWSVGSREWSSPGSMELHMFDN